MPKYTEEQLFEARELAYTPKPDVLDAFSRLVESVGEHLASERRNKRDTFTNEQGQERSYTHFNRRRLSRGANNAPKPNLRRKSEVSVDEEGWETCAKPRKSFGGDEHSDDRNSFRDLVTRSNSNSSSAVHARPNTKNVGSSKAVDPRDAIAHKHTNTFKAFEALGDDDNE